MENEPTSATTHSAVLWLEEARRIIAEGGKGRPPEDVTNDEIKTLMAAGFIRIICPHLVDKELAMSLDAFAAGIRINLAPHPDDRSKPH